LIAQRRLQREIGLAQMLAHHRIFRLLEPLPQPHHALAQRRGRVAAKICVDLPRPEG